MMSLPISQQSLNQLKNWKIVDEKLQQVFVFRDFIQAFGFMAQVAIVADKMNHHPEWSNVYKTVTVDLTTHSEGCVTQLDAELAEKMDEISDQINNR